MKANIHPEYVEIDVTCACGNHWRTRSTKASIRTDICSNCHPFYSGASKFVDTLGRVDRFTKKFGGEYFVKTVKKKARGRAGRAALSAANSYRFRP